MSQGYWLVRVNRVTGDATTKYIEEQQDAWQGAIDAESPIIYTTVVNRHIPQGGKRG